MNNVLKILSVGLFLSAGKKIFSKQLYGNEFVLYC